MLLGELFSYVDIHASTFAAAGIIQTIANNQTHNYLIHK